MRLRKLEPHESSLLRELRLRALQDAPGSFRDTYSDMAARPSSYWDELTRSVTEANQNVMFLAYEGDHPVGSAFALVDRVRSRTGRAGGMWVEPQWRRRGIGEALLQEVINWARERDFERLQLWCAVDAVGPSSLYRKAGFKETGNQQPLSEESAFRVAEMELPL
ncbi:GNAT family N-acetyltransferase [Variovorax ureilyticus]|uniref:GNAT family N-acetyltransferase n=1 Tax=Variovorax ureilyticus TaxID=1836198 RepID=A0ABU8VT90_9BURK